MAAKHVLDEDEIELINFSLPSKLQSSAKTKTKLILEPRNDFTDVMSSCKIPNDVSLQPQDSTSRFSHRKESRIRSKITELLGKKDDKLKPLKYETIIDLSVINETDLTSAREGSKKNRRSSRFNVSQISKHKEEGNQPKEMLLLTKTAHTDRGKTRLPKHKSVLFKDMYIENIPSVYPEKIIKKDRKQRRREMRPYKHDIRVEMTPRDDRCRIREERAIMQDTFDVLPEATVRLDKYDSLPERAIRRDNFKVNTERTVKQDKFSVISEETMRRDKFESFPQWKRKHVQFAVHLEETMIPGKLDVLQKETMRPDKLDILQEETMRRDKLDILQKETMRRDKLYVLQKETMSPDKLEVLQKEIMRPDKLYVLQKETMRPDKLDVLQKETMRPDKLDVLQKYTMRPDKLDVLQKETMRPDKLDVLQEDTMIDDEFVAISKRRISRDRCNIPHDNTCLKEVTHTEERNINDNTGLLYGKSNFSKLNIDSVPARISVLNTEFPLHNKNHNNSTTITSSCSLDSNDNNNLEKELNKNTNNATDTFSEATGLDSRSHEASSESLESTDETTTENTKSSGILDSSESSEQNETEESHDEISNRETSTSPDSPDSADKSELEATGSSSGRQSGDSSEDNDSKRSSGSTEKKDSSSSLESLGSSKDSNGSPDSNGSKGSSSSSSSSSSDGKKKKVKKRKGFFMKLLKSSPEEHILMKMVLWFPVGIGISVILYFLIVRKMNLEEKYKAIVGAALGIVLSLTFSFSVQMRCVMTLVVPSFVGKAGRSYFAAFAIVYLINGPITNIMENCKEVVRCMTCNSALTANHTRVKWKLRLHPVELALGDLMKDNYLITRSSKSVKRAFKPLRKEIEANKVENDELKKDIKKVEKAEGRKSSAVDGIEKRYKTQEEKEAAGKKVEQAWAKKLDLRCQSVFSNGVQRCKDKMGALWDKCLDKLWLLGYLLCWPLKMTFFCEIIKLIPGFLGTECKAVSEVNPGFGDTFLSAEGVMNDMESGSNVNMQYKIVGSAEANYMPVEEMRQTTMHEVKAKTETINIGLNLISHFLTFTFLIIFYGAYKYNNNYLADLHWDNKYITPYFRHIDARRKAQKKRTLLPLKKAEKKEVYDPNQIKLALAEKKQMVKGTVKLLMRVIVSAIIIYMDSMFYQVLDIIARNSKIEYHQTGEHTVDIKIYGRGFMSAIVRSLLERFNFKQTLDSLTTNYDCLPKPFKTDIVIICFIFGTYMIVWLFMYFQTFGLRMRRVIASFYYRKREKKRILFLYNEMYRKRIGFLLHMRAKVRKELRNREYKKKVGLLLALKRQHRFLSKCLSIFKSTKEPCIICSEPETKESYMCPTEGCGVGYCSECWIDIKKKCYACGQTEIEDDDTDSQTSEDADSTSDEDSE